MNKPCVFFCTGALSTLLCSATIAQTMDHSDHNMDMAMDMNMAEDSMDMPMGDTPRSEPAMDMDMSPDIRMDSSMNMPMDTGMDMDMDMSLDTKGLVMNQNTDTLPQDCAALGPDISLTVYAGTEFAAEYPGTVFGLSEHEYRVEPCSRITVTFINNDNIRHQWMVHGLPKYLYPQGMFHMEAAGGEQRTGTFIVPSDSKTYLVHCDMAQHMEKGMKAQLLVAGGDGDLWSVPGVTATYNTDDSLSKSAIILLITMTLSGFFGAGLFLHRKN